MKTRNEKDSLGTIALPDNVYYGIQTARSLQNFPISGLHLHPEMVRAYLYVKYAAAKVNGELGVIPKKISIAIMQAAKEALDGKFNNDFVVDAYQAGAGTSFNMNVNEVLANRASEILGGNKGDLDYVRPNDHVNAAQSTNDTFPAALKIATLILEKKLHVKVQELINAFNKKGNEFRTIIKAGRTHLQDAVPITLGREFKAYANVLIKTLQRITDNFSNLKCCNLGATAVGTGLNAHPKYAQKVVVELNKITKLQLKNPKDFVEATQNACDFAAASSALKCLAIDLIKIANDLRLLCSGPATGFNEIELPAVQPGSSIMPGKVNPVMAEMLDMVGFEVIGHDLTIAMATQAGQLELNVMLPIVAKDLLESLEILTNSIGAFTNRCVLGIKADRALCLRHAERSLALITVLAPHIGYLQAAEIAKSALKEHKTIRGKLIESKLLDTKKLDELLDLNKMLHN